METAAPQKSPPLWPLAMALWLGGGTVAATPPPGCGSPAPAPCAPPGDATARPAEAGADRRAPPGAGHAAGRGGSRPARPEG